MAAACSFVDSRETPFPCEPAHEVRMRRNEAELFRLGGAATVAASSDSRT